MSEGTDSNLLTFPLMDGDPDLTRLDITWYSPSFAIVRYSAVKPLSKAVYDREGKVKDLQADPYFDCTNGE